MKYLQYLLITLLCVWSVQASDDETSQQFNQRVATANIEQLQALWTGYDLDANPEKVSTDPLLRTLLQENMARLIQAQKDVKQQANVLAAISDDLFRNQMLFEHFNDAQRDLIMKESVLSFTTQV